jgi:hypothetical protein
MITPRRILPPPIFLLIALLVTGCANPGTKIPTPINDSEIRSVAVVSLIDERTKFLRTIPLGKSKEAVVDQSGVLNPLAVNVVTERLRAARPSWEFKNSDAEHEKLLQAKKAGGISFMNLVSAFTPALAETAKRLEVDALFVIVEDSLDNFTGYGVGGTWHVMGKREPSIHALVQLVLVGKDGRQIAQRWGGDRAYFYAPAADLGVDPDLESFSNPLVVERFKRATRLLLRDGLVQAVNRMGYNQQ